MNTLVLVTVLKAEVIDSSMLQVGALHHHGGLGVMAEDQSGGGELRMIRMVVQVSLVHRVINALLLQDHVVVVVEVGAAHHRDGAAGAVRLHGHGVGRGRRGAVLVVDVAVDAVVAIAAAVEYCPGLRSGPGEVVVDLVLFQVPVHPHHDAACLLFGYWHDYSADDQLL